MSHSDLATSGKRGNSLERCTQQQSTGKLELKGVIVVIQQGYNFERVVVALHIFTLLNGLHHYFPGFTTSYLTLLSA